MRIRVANSLVLLLYTAMAVATGLSFYSFNLAQAQQMLAARRQLWFADQVARFLAGSKLLTSSVQTYAATGDDRFAQAYWREVHVTRSRDRAAAALQRLGLTPQENLLMRRARAESDTLIQREEAALTAGRRGQRERAIELVFGPVYQQALRRIYAPSEELQRRISARMDAELAAQRQRAGALWTLCLSLLLLDLLLVYTVLALVYPRFITGPLLQLDRRLQQRLCDEAPGPMPPLRAAATEIRALAASLAAQERLAEQLGRDQWAKAQQVRISAALQLQNSPEAVAARFLQDLAPLLQIGAATCYGVEPERGELQLLATYASAELAPVPPRLVPGEGLLGECLRQARPLEVASPPPGYLTVRGGLGWLEPKALLLLPVLSGGRVLAVVELALLRPLLAHERALLDDLLPFLALALEGALDSSAPAASSAASSAPSPVNPPLHPPAHSPGNPPPPPPAKPSTDPSPSEPIPR